MSDDTVMLFGTSFSVLQSNEYAATSALQMSYFRFWNSLCELLGSVPAAAYPDEAGKKITALNKCNVESTAGYHSCCLVLSYV